MNKFYRTLIFAFLSLAALESVLFADLNPLNDWMENLVKEEKVVGCMAHITENGETIFLKAVGRRSPDSTDELQTEQVVRIYSMTKAIASVATLQLIEQGEVGIDDLVSKYIPSFKNVKVLENGKLRDAEKEITIRELITHTSGIAYDFSASPELKPYYEDAFVGVHSLEEAANIIAKLPLAHDPGKAFTYGLGIDVLGRVIEIASDKSLEEHLKENIFKPLGMMHTSFTPDKSIVQMPIVNRTSNGLRIDKVHYQTEKDVLNATFPSGGGGLWSTIGDYSRFCMAIENFGELDGIRILNPETVVFMTQNHLSPSINRNKPVHERNRFGLGLGIQPPVMTSKGFKGGGRWTWGGAACTYFFIDHKQNITAVFATQLFPFDHGLNEEFHHIVLESLAQEQMN